MPNPPNVARATQNACPYCGESTLQVSGDRPHPEELAMLCSSVSCLKFCTSKNGKFYPHDDHQDPVSSIGKVVRY
jgi:hypothetical protein